MQKSERLLNNHQLEIWDLSKPECYDTEGCYSKHIVESCILDLRTPVNAKKHKLG